MNFQMSCLLITTLVAEHLFNFSVVWVDRAENVRPCLFNVVPNGIRPQHTCRLRGMRATNLLQDIMVLEYASFPPPTTIGLNIVPGKGLLRRCLP